MSYNYIEAISIGFPTVGCHVLDDGTTYETIVWDNGEPLPSKEVLDTWIASNAPSQNRRITVYAIRQRFTIPERVGIELTSIDNPTASDDIRQFSALLRVVLMDLQSATFVDLDNTNVIQLIQMLEQRGLIGSGRASEILNGVVLPTEMPDK
jgi:hypothetical protein